MLTKCKYCSQEFEISDYTKAELEGREKPKYPSKKGRKGSPHSEDTKNRLRTVALSSNHRRLKKSTRVYVDSNGNRVLLDSLWEEVLARRLDDLKIRWSRPNPIKWLDSQGVTHHYFPDFYLHEHDVYLDPKNPYAYERQREKIEALKQQGVNVIFLTSIDSCSEFDIDSITGI